MGVVAIEHIEVDERGVAKIVGTRSKVRQIVVDAMNGLSPEDIRTQYPHLRLAQIYAALAYYHDHKAEIDAEIAEGHRFADAMRTKHPNRFTREELLERLPPDDRERLARESERLTADDSSGS